MPFNIGGPELAILAFLILLALAALKGPAWANLVNSPWGVPVLVRIALKLLKCVLKSIPVRLRDATFQLFIFPTNSRVQPSQLVRLLLIRWRGSQLVPLRV